MIKVNKQLAQTVTWEQDPDSFDIRLHQLGQGADEFIVVNPKYDPWILDFVDFNQFTSDRCLVWHVNNTWIVKKFKADWTPSKGWELIDCVIDIDLEVEFNPELEFLNFNFDISIPFDDAAYEYVYYLDSSLDPEGLRPWVAKARYPGIEILGTKEQQSVLPTTLPVLTFNTEIPKVEFDNTFTVPYYDLSYENTWYLDSKFNPTNDNIWVAKLSYPDAYQVKDQGTAAPKIIFNKDIPNLDYFIEESIPYYDLVYEHVWMLDSSLHTDINDIWAAKILPADSQGVKIIGKIGVRMADFDVVFISYHEPNAEANWYRVLEKFPRAKRVKNVQGIFEAHKQAAQMATTPMFYVIDGDAELVDTWEFNFKVNVFDMDCVHLWTSINPINDLEYGYGGVKLFPRQLLLDATTWNIDLTTGLGKLKLINKISNVTAFNYDPFTTWRSAFRECVKLSSSLDPDALRRLEIWCTMGADRENGQYAIDGAKLGRQYGMDHLNDPDKLKLINNYDWMKHEFNEFYRQQ